MGEEDDVGVGRALQRGERAAGPRRAEMPHRRGALGLAWWPRCRSRSIARLRRSAVTLPPSGKISTASSAPRPWLIALISTLDVAAARVHEPVRQPPADDVDERVEREQLVHDDPRPALVAAQQVVEHQQRVALAGVDAEHDQRPLRAASAASAGAEPCIVIFTRATRSAARATRR